MKYITFVLILFLAGCTSVPIKHAFPEIPTVITEKCPNLNKLAEDEERLSEFLKVVTTNYSLYYECSTKHELLVKWLNEQKAIHDAVFNKGK